MGNATIKVHSADTIEAAIAGVNNAVRGPDQSREQSLHEFDSNIRILREVSGELLELRQLADTAHVVHPEADIPFGKPSPAPPPTSPAAAESTDRGQVRLLLIDAKDVSDSVTREICKLLEAV